MGHLGKEELQKRIEEAKTKVEVGAKYSHYKNPDKYYVVEELGFIEETEEVCVIYRPHYDDGYVWVRTLENFTEEVHGNGPRFYKT